jgi:hypothetical protein
VPGISEFAILEHEYSKVTGFALRLLKKNDVQEQELKENL